MCGASLNISVSRVPPGLHSAALDLPVPMCDSGTDSQVEGLVTTRQQNRSRLLKLGLLVQDVAWRCWHLLLYRCLCFCSSTHSSRDTGKGPAGCLHPSQGGVFTDPPPLSSFMQRERGCVNAGTALGTVAPSVCGGYLCRTLWVPVPD